MAFYLYRLPWQTLAISMGLWWCGATLASAMTFWECWGHHGCAALDQAACSVQPITDHRDGMLGSHQVFQLRVAHRTPLSLPGMGCIAFALMSSMIRSSENKEERWQCSNAFITFITFTSVTRKLIARYLYSPFPFPPLPALLLRYICPLWRALGFVLSTSSNGPCVLQERGSLYF